MSGWQPLAHFPDRWQDGHLISGLIGHRGNRPRGVIPEEADLRSEPCECRFTGFFNKNQQVSLWSNSSPREVPSVWDEPFGMVVLEDWAKERPLVACAKGTLPELIRQGVYGLLAAPFSIDDLAKNIQELIDNPDLDPCLGRAGNQHLIKESNCALWLSRIESVYENIVPT